MSLLGNILLPDVCILNRKKQTISSNRTGVTDQEPSNIDQFIKCFISINSFIPCINLLVRNYHSAHFFSGTERLMTLAIVTQP